MSPCVWSLIIFCVGLSYKAILVEGQATCQCVCSNDDFEATDIESKKKIGGKQPGKPGGKPGGPVGKPGSPVGKPGSAGSKPGKPGGKPPAGSTGDNSPGSTGKKPSGSKGKGHKGTTSKPSGSKPSPRTMASVRPTRRPSRPTKKPLRKSIGPFLTTVHGIINTAINAGQFGVAIAELLTRQMDTRYKDNPDDKYSAAEQLKEVFLLKLEENKKVINDLQGQINELTEGDEDDRKTLEEDLVTQKSIDDELTDAFNQLDAYQEQVEKEIPDSNTQSKE